MGLFILQENYNPFIAYIKQKLLKENLGNGIGFFIFTILSILSAYLIITFGLAFSLTIIAFIFSIFFLIICFNSTKHGLILLIIIAFSVFKLKSFIDFPFGTLIELTGIVLITSIIIKKDYAKELLFYKTPVFYAIIIYILYVMLQIANPNGPIMGWVSEARKVIPLFSLFVIPFAAFNKYSYLKKFTWLWIILALYVCTVGLRQEWIGLTGSEMTMLRSNEKFFQLHFQQGRLRVWSFLSEAATFGLFMGYVSIFCLILSLNSQIKNLYRIFLVILAVLCLLAMSYSGTRTANGIVVVGLVFFGIMTLHKGRTFVFMIAGTLIFVILLVAPIYNNRVLNRFRSTFSPDKDASFNVRSINRNRIQPYMLSHPIGGGYGTSGATGNFVAPWHPLAGFPPDSAYVRTAIEGGWIGLFLRCLLYMIIAVTGVLLFYKISNSSLQYYYLAYFSGFISLCVAGYAQPDIEQLPMGVIFLLTPGILYNIYLIDKKTSNIDKLI